MKRTGVAAKMVKLLPIVTSEGIMTGFIPEDWQVKQRSETNSDYLLFRAEHYHRCCQDPRNWIGVGEFRGLKDASDPYYHSGYRSYRAVNCGACNQSVNAHELSVREVG